MEFHVKYNVRKEAEMAFDDILQHLGEFGRYQKRIYFLLCLPAILCALHRMAGVFTQVNVNHRCQLPYEHGNASYILPDIKKVIPWDPKTRKWSSCEILDATFTMDYFKAGIPSSFNKSVKCDKWIYDTSVYDNSVVTEFNLVCDNAHFRVMADSLFMLGVLLGSIIFGGLSDRFGRRPIFFLSLVLQVLFGLLAAGAPEYYTYMASRLLIGSTTSAVFLVAYVIAMEMVGPSKRLFAGVVCQLFFTTGYILTSVFAYFIREWRLLQVALSAPGIIFLFYWWFIPESAHWLLTKGREVEAKHLLLEVAKENKVHISDGIIDDLLPHCTTVKEDKKTKQDLAYKKTTEKQPTLIDLFCYPNLCKKTVIILISWFIISGTYYGLSWNTSNLSGNNYVNFFFSGVVEIPGYLFPLFVLDKWGRKWPLCFCMILGGVVLLLIAIIPPDMNWFITTLAMTGKMITTASYGIIYVFSAEQFPTVVRNTGIGAASMSARIGGIFAPYIILLGDHWKPWPFIIYGTLALLGGIPTLLLPETLNKKLPDSMQEGEMFGFKNKKDTEDLTTNVEEIHMSSNPNLFDRNGST